ncbi:hypothetical protein [Halovulum sp. GXIMD14793]
MTALQKYIRLEATGQWRESRAHAPREVVVSFGKATLVLSDFQDRPLTHWALAAIGVVGSGPGVAYALDAAGDETLQIDDAQMNAAIAEVTAEAREVADQLTIPRQGRRWSLILLTLLGLVALAVWKCPGFLRTQALNLIPQEKATLIGREVVASLGTVCASSGDLPGLARLATVLNLPLDRRLGVAKGSTPLAVMPGGDILVGDDFLAEMRSPDALAGWVLMAHLADPDGRAQLAGLMQDKPLGQLGRFMMNGDISAEDISTLVRSISDAEVQVTLDRLSAAQAGLADRGLADKGFVTSALQHHPGQAAGLSAKVDEGKPVMRDQAWVAVQQACNQ